VKKLWFFKAITLVTVLVLVLASTSAVFAGGGGNGKGNGNHGGGPPEHSNAGGNGKGNGNHGGGPPEHSNAGGDRDGAWDGDFDDPGEWPPGHQRDKENKIYYYKLLPNGKCLKRLHPVNEHNGWSTDIAVCQGIQPEEPEEPEEPVTPPGEKVVPEGPPWCQLRFVNTDILGVNLLAWEVFNEEAKPKEGAWEWMVHFSEKDDGFVIHRPCDELVSIWPHHQLTSHVFVDEVPMTAEVIDLSAYHQKVINAYNTALEALSAKIGQ